MDTLRSLIAQRDELEERIRQLRALIAPKTDFPLQLGLTPSEAVIASVLMTRPLARRDVLIEALWVDGDVPNEYYQTIRTLISRLRSKFAVYGVTIHNKYAEGWFMTLDDRRKLSAIIQALKDNT